MKQYCLDDICWIYNQDGSFVTPFIFNIEGTKIKDLSGSDEIIEIDKASPSLSVKRYFANILNCEENYFSIVNFCTLVVNGPLMSKSVKLKLKGIRNLNFAKLQHDLIKNKGTTKYYETFIVNDDDIKTITREIIQHLNPQTKKQKDCKKLHDLTTRF